MGLGTRGRAGALRSALIFAWAGVTVQVQRRDAGRQVRGNGVALNLGQKLEAKGLMVMRVADLAKTASPD